MKSPADFLEYLHPTLLLTWKPRQIPLVLQGVPRSAQPKLCFSARLPPCSRADMCPYARLPLGSRTHLRHGGQEIPWGGLERAQERARQGPHGGQSLHVLVGEDCFPLLFPLSEGHVERLCADNPPVHFCHSLGSLFWGGKTYKPKAFAAATFRHHLKQH